MARSQRASSRSPPQSAIHASPAADGGRVSAERAAAARSATRDRSCRGVSATNWSRRRSARCCAALRTVSPAPASRAAALAFHHDSISRAASSSAPAAARMTAGETRPVTSGVDMASTSDTAHAEVVARPLVPASRKAGDPGSCRHASQPRQPRAGAHACATIGVRCRSAPSASAGGRSVARARQASSACRARSTHSTSLRGVTTMAGETLSKAPTLGAPIATVASCSLRRTRVSTRASASPLAGGDMA